jgi:hypothetical protein
MIVSPPLICRDQKFRGFASVGLLDSNEAWVTLFSHEKRSNTGVIIGSHCGGLLYDDPLILPTVAQHADPLPKSVLYVHRVAASDRNPASNPASPIPFSEAVVAPAKPVVAPGRHRLVPALPPALPPASSVLPQLSNHSRLSHESPSSTTRISMSLGMSTT